MAPKGPTQELVQIVSVVRKGVVNGLLQNRSVTIVTVFPSTAQGRGDSPLSRARVIDAILHCRCRSCCDPPRASLASIDPLDVLPSTGVFSSGLPLSSIALVPGATFRPLPWPYRLEYCIFSVQHCSTQWLEVNIEDVMIETSKVACESAP